jgi:PIN domain nuclease of toxin-antitoxin system
VKLLLDTHIALWSLTDDPRLSSAARTLILDPENEICVSAVTLWEIAIKHGLGRSGPNAMPISGAEAMNLFLASGYDLIEIMPTEAVLVEQLPAIHADPFDRLLIVQGLAAGFRLITHDAVVASYSPHIIRV